MAGRIDGRVGGRMAKAAAGESTHARLRIAVEIELADRVGVGDPCVARGVGAEAQAVRQPAAGEPAVRRDSLARRKAHRTVGSYAAAELGELSAVAAHPDVLLRIDCE